MRATKTRKDGRGTKSRGPGSQPTAKKVAVDDLVTAMIGRQHRPNGPKLNCDVWIAMCTRCLCLGILHTSANTIDGTAVNFDCDPSAVDKE